MYPCEFSLEVSNLSCERGFKRLFDDLCFRLEAGEVAHVTGLNGAGKTTLLRAIAGLFEAESGEISLHGHDAEDRSGVAYLGHKIALRGSLTGRENLEFAGKIQRGHCAVSIDESIDLLQAGEYADIPVAQLSAGQKQRIALARVIRTGAQLWLLDEPATALDGDGVAVLQQIIGQHAQANGLTLYTSHQPLHLSASGLKTIHI